MSTLLGLYPRSWRERYLVEMEELLAVRPPTLLERLDLVVGAVDAWIHPQVRRPSGEVAHGPERTAATVAAVLGGVLFAASGLVIASSREVTAEGYQDNGPGVPLLIVGMILTAIVALAVAGGGRPRRIAGVMLGGALAVMLPWPIALFGLFGYCGATIALGAAWLAQDRLIGLALILIGVGLTSFNTETDWALVTVPVGILWAVVALVIGRSGAPVAAPVPAPRVGGARG